MRRQARCAITTRTYRREQHRGQLAMRTVLQGADRVPQMKPCRMCGKPKSPEQRLAIDEDGRLIHKECKS